MGQDLDRTGAKVLSFVHPRPLPARIRRLLFNQYWVLSFKAVGLRAPRGGHMGHADTMWSTV